MEQMDKNGLDLTKVNIEKLKAIFPECVSDGKIDFDMLKLLLGGEVDNSQEKYSFNWVGKADSIKIAQMPTAGTLLPCKEKSLNWDTTQNLYIEGDNLEVLKTLTKTYHGLIKMIYIDPPYNTGHDFVYHDDFKDNMQNYVENSTQSFRTNPETSGRFHTDWLNMMYPRLKIAKDLLKDDGMIFISINDKEIQNLKKICAEIFGAENEVATLIWDKNHSAQAGIYKIYHEYVLVYCNDINKISKPSSLQNDIFEAGAMKKISGRHPASEFTFPAGTRIEAPDGTEISGEYGDAEKVIVTKGKIIAKDHKLVEDVTLKAGFTQANQMRQYFYGDRSTCVDSQGQKIVEFYLSSTGKVKVLKERSVETPQTTCRFGTQGAASNDLAELFDLKECPFSSPKPVNMVTDFIKRFTKNDDIILDFFSGSATTAQAVMEINSSMEDYNLHYILVQIPENLDESLKQAQKDAVRTLQVAIDYLDKVGKPHTICEIGVERIRRAGKKIYSELKEKKANAGLLTEGVIDPDSLDIGFKVFKLDSTNIRPWDATIRHDETTLYNLLDVLKEGRSNLDVAYEVMLKYGVFNMPLEEVQANGKTVYSVGSNYMIISLNDEVTSDDVLAIAKLEPKAVVFKESGFKDDNEKMNAEYTFKRLGIDNVKCI